MRSHDIAELISFAPQPDGSLAAVPRVGPFAMPDYGPPLTSLAALARQVARVRLEAIERAVTGWAEQAGVTVEEWLKVYGYTVEQGFEEGGAKLTFTVKPALGFPGCEVVFKQPV